mmetsp:Transcript_4815/g.8318  ORF Transcript_4815/g.8318 Transcript_4815/m.8318 type:complete len:435 (-) Transcript_4815:42-1346(-)
MPRQKVAVGAASEPGPQNATAPTTVQAEFAQKRYKVLGSLNLQMGLKLQQVYTAEELEERCRKKHKSSVSKLVELQTHMRNANSRKEGSVLELVKSPPIATGNDAQSRAAASTESIVPNGAKVDAIAPASAAGTASDIATVTASGTATAAEHPRVAEAQPGAMEKASATAPEPQMTESTAKKSAERSPSTPAPTRVEEKTRTAADPLTLEPLTKKRKEDKSSSSKVGPVVTITDSPPAASATSLAEPSHKADEDTRGKFRPALQVGQVVWPPPAVVAGLPSHHLGKYQLKLLDSTLASEEASPLSASEGMLRPVVEAEIPLIKQLTKGGAPVSVPDLTAQVPDMQTHRESFKAGQLVWIWRCHGMPVWFGTVKAELGEHLYAVQPFSGNHLTLSGWDANPEIRAHADSLMHCEGGSSCDALLDLIEEAKKAKSQ